MLEVFVLLSSELKSISMSGMESIENENGGGSGSGNGNGNEVSPKKLGFQ